MRRAGRKRKCRVAREANGQHQRILAPERAEQIIELACQSPHRRDIIDMTGRKPKPADPRDPRLESELGRLRVRGILTGEQYAAGRRWAGIMARMRQAIGAPLDRPKGIMASLMASTGGRGEMSAEQVIEARAAYAEADHVLVADWRNRGLPDLLNLVIIQDHPCPDMPRLLLALHLLAEHFATQGQASTIPRRIPDVAATA